MSNSLASSDERSPLLSNLNTNPFDALPSASLQAEADLLSSIGKCQPGYWRGKVGFLSSCYVI